MFFQDNRSELVLAGAVAFSKLIAPVLGGVVMG